MAQGLSILAQEDFSAGAIRSMARHLIPPNGLYTAQNALLDDDGSVYRRGGSEYLSNVAFGVAGAMKWLWSGHLAAGPRTAFSADTARLGVLAADDATPIELGSGSVDYSTGRSAVVNGMLFLPGGTIYGGSRKAADYSAGTITITQGSKIVTGTGTEFLANVDPGMLLHGTTRYHVVASVDSDTQLTLVDAMEQASGTTTYNLVRLGSTALTDYRTADSYATVAERLVALEGSRAYFSRGRNELGELKTHVFDDTNYHELPAGAVMLAAESIRDLLVVFATDGVWTINNMAFDLTDAVGNPQQQMQRTGQDVVLWGTGGIASYGGALVAAATDGVYLVDGVSPPVSVSESITPLLTVHVRAGREPGVGCVFDGHYLLPVIERVPAFAVADLLVCRLDRPVRARSRTFFPWSWFTGHGGGVSALASRVAADGTDPELLGGASDRRVLNLTGVFTPDTGNITDADGTTHQFLIETRDFPTGRGNVNTVRRARVRYELDYAGGTATLTGSYSTGSASFTALTGAAPEDDGTNKHTWHFAATGRYIRLRIQSADPASRLTLRSVEIAVRQSGKDR